MHSPRPGVKFSSRQSSNRTLWFFIYLRAVHFSRSHLGERMLYVWESGFDDDDQ
jgi:hypothetical protein